MTLFEFCLEFGVELYVEYVVSGRYLDQTEEEFYEEAYELYMKQQEASDDV